MKILKSDPKIQMIQRQVILNGLTPIMFDRYPGDNRTKLHWGQKIYLMPGTNILALPAINISSFLSAQHTESAPKRLREAKKYKAICNACKSFTLAKSDDPHNPDFIPFLRNGEKIEVGHKFDDELEPMSGLYLSRHVARLKDGIPNPKERPTLPLPWSLAFMFLIFPNSEIKEEEIYNLFVEGGLAIGFGTYRGCFGKFEVVKWE